MSQWQQQLLGMKRVPGITAVMIYCTPEFAGVLVGLNTHNRTRMPTLIEKYAREIVNGAWLPVSTGVGIDENGVITNGQHRLEAIIKTGMTVPLLIVYGLPAASRLKDDRHSPWGLSKSLAFTGFCGSGTRYVSVTKSLLRISMKSSTIADSDVQDAIEVHRPALDEVNKLPHTTGFTAAILAGLVYGYEVNQAKMVELIPKLTNPTDMTADDPRYRLFLMIHDGSQKRGGKARQDVEFRKTLYCIKAWFEGRKITKVLEASSLNGEA